MPDDFEACSIAVDRLKHPAKRWTLEELERGVDLNSTATIDEDFARDVQEASKLTAKR